MTICERRNVRPKVARVIYCSRIFFRLVLANTYQTSIKLYIAHDGIPLGSGSANCEICAQLITGLCRLDRCVFGCLHIGLRNMRAQRRTHFSRRLLAKRVHNSRMHNVNRGVVSASRRSCTARWNDPTTTQRWCSCVCVDDEHIIQRERVRIPCETN